MCQSTFPLQSKARTSRRQARRTELLCCAAECERLTSYGKPLGGQAARFGCAPRCRHERFETSALRKRVNDNKIYLHAAAVAERARLFWQAAGANASTRGRESAKSLRFATTEAATLHTVYSGCDKFVIPGGSACVARSEASRGLAMARKAAVWPAVALAAKHEATGGHPMFTPICAICRQSQKTHRSSDSF